MVTRSFEFFLNQPNLKTTAKERLHYLQKICFSVHWLIRKVLKYVLR
jgi:hypothetical protein